MAKVKAAATAGGKPGFLLFPRPLGLLVMLVAGLSLAAGLKQGEAVTILLGAALGMALGWAFAGSLALTLIHRPRASLLSIRMVPQAVPAGGEGTLVLDRGGAGGFFRLPGLLVRCETRLSTADRRRLELVFDPDRLEGGGLPFRAPLRGAYSGREDCFLVTDILGLFRVSVPLPAAEGPRLLSMPAAAELPALQLRGSGGEERRSGEERVRRDSFTGHRPYAPGDDPRRINWKLYGHLGDLFVREGEPEPPPLSRLTILIDTQYDPRLYTPEGGSRGVDLLCENALALITECLRLGMEAELGYSGGSALISGTAPDFAAALAHPAALAFHGEAESAELPAAGDRVLVLALPREEALESGLDRFLRSRGPTDLVFLRQDDGQGAGETAAEACAAYYARRPGLRVSSLLLPPALDGVK